MPKLRKQRRKQKYQYHVNRRKLHLKQKKKLTPKISCNVIREAWDPKKSLNDNMESMGLMVDPNSHERLNIQRSKRTTKTKSEALPEKGSVAVALQKEAADKYEEKRKIIHALPPEMLRKLTTFIDKHGEDFEAMARDPRNYYQETAAQLKKQITRLKSIPQQWVPYLKSRGLVVPDEDSTG